MKLGHLVVGLGLGLELGLAALPVVAQGREPLSPEVLYERSKVSVVTILTLDADHKPLGQGSGFIVGQNRVVTNFHVLAGSSSAEIAFNDGSTTTVGAVVAASGAGDLAIVEAETGARPALAFGDELQLKVGETVYAIGAPNGLMASLSNGLVSAFRQGEGRFLIQITAPITHGSSGGPLLNRQGQVVGVTSSGVEGTGFGFAIGAGGVQRLLKAPLGVKARLSDLVDDRERENPASELSAVQKLLDDKKYAAARQSFGALSDAAKASFEGQSLLCDIAYKQGDYQVSIEACDAAIQLKPTAGVPYGLKASSYLLLGDLEQAETFALKAVQKPDGAGFRPLLAIIHYSQERYDRVAKDISSDTNDPFELTLLAGAALHNANYDLFSRLRTRVTAIKGVNNGWALFMEGLAAEKDLKWDVAAAKFRKCEADKDFIDPGCMLGVVEVELRETSYSAAKRDIDKTLSRYPRNHEVIAQAIFIDLLVGNSEAADKLHEVLKARPVGRDDLTDCLYYYGRNQPLLATSPCRAAVRRIPNSRDTWSNAGYAALDTGSYEEARADFDKAVELYNASKASHTVTEQVETSWGVILATYYSGNKKRAKEVYRDLKKDHPQFMTMAGLKQLPLVWSDATIKMIERVGGDFR